MAIHRKSRRILLILLALTLLTPAASSQSLADIYKTGKMRFAKEIAVTDKAFPKDIYFEEPRGVAVDKTGNIYVADSNSNHIKVFAPDGRFLKTLGRRGNGPGELNGPEYLDVSGDRIAVWESMNRRLSLLRLDGVFVKQLQFDRNTTGLPFRIRCLPDGRFVVETEKYVADEAKPPQEWRLELYAPDLTHLKTVCAQPLTAALLANAPNMGRVRVPQPYNPKLHWDVAADGKIVIGYSNKYEIGVFDPDKGKLFSFTHAYDPVRIEESDKKKHFYVFKTTVFKDGARTVLDKTPDFIISNTLFPEYKPPFDGIIADSAGNFWVKAFRKDRKLDERTFDVFGPRGEFIATVEIAGDTDNYFNQASRIVNGVFWKIEKDEEEYNQLVKYRIAK